ncbi:MAG TPA: SDR family NAD(P)-dependent oxidoreductase [Dokdonella sp.]|jgi:NADP-dependent 3-hydroxy acid dehydrogenase YdfG|nr:SDR family NAD(P)-dependent oxidoreductase [Dokdonella sp.]
MTRKEGLLAGRSVAVTGASRGIGLAIVALLADNGARVIGGARTIDGIHVDGVRFIELDVTSESSAEEFAQAAISADADTLVNNAGVGSFAPLEDILVSDYRRVMDTNVLGMILATRCLVPHFRARHARGLGSQVINITSDVSNRTFAHGGLYTASKYAQRALTRALAHEGAGYGLRVTEVRPGMTDTCFNGNTPGSTERALDLRPGDVAASVLHALCAPAHVRIDEVLVHPTRQDVAF